MMKRCWFGIVSAGVSCLLGACARPIAQAPLSASVPPATRATSSDEFAEVGTFVDRGVPKGVVIWLRVPAPGRDIPLLGTLMGVGSILDPNELLSRKLGPQLSRAVDLSKPVDLTMTGIGDAPKRMGLATGITNMNTFLAIARSDFRMVHKSAGRWQLEPNAKREDESEVLECELWQAAEPVGARLVCASDAGLIEQQGQFLMAAARTSVDHANFHAEVPGSALESAVKNGVDTETPRDQEEGARAGSVLGRNLVNDFAHDLSGISWDLTLQRDSVEVAQVLAFARSSSLLTTSLSGRAGAPEAVPEAFWRLPADSDLTLYSEGAEPAPLRKIAASWLHELRVASETDNEYDFPPAVMDRLERLLDSLAFRGGSWELAYGHDLEGASQVLSLAAAKASSRTPRSTGADPALVKARAELGGWALVGLHEDAQTYLAALRDALNLAADRTKYPRKKAAKPYNSSTCHAFSERPLKPTVGLPKDALHFTASFWPNPKYVPNSESKGKETASAPITYHVLVLADAPHHLWFALSPDEALATARLREVLSSEPAKTLSGNAELRQFTQGPIVGLGYGTLAGLSALSLSADTKPNVLKSQRTLKGLWALPKRGATRVPLWITRTQSAQGERRIAVSARLTPDAIGDVLANFIGIAANPHLIEGE